MLRRALLLICGCATLAVAQDNQPSLLDRAIERSRRNVSQRVVGASPVPIADNPWQVAIVWTNGDDNLTSQFCGGSIIARGWVLTAGHCIDQTKPAAFYEVFSGSASLTTGGIRSRILNYCVHKQFTSTPDGMRHYYDIALLEIDPHGPPLRGSPIAGIPQHGSGLSPGTLVRITGWGATQRSYQPTTVLQGVDVHYVDNATCNRKVSYNNQIQDYMLCAGEKGGGKDTCQGDSGGPASAEIDRVRRLVGVASWGDGCAEPDLYGVYTRVSEFRDWVHVNTRGAVTW